VRSVRKSLLSALYGIAVGRGLINVNNSLADLGIDDRGGLTAQEKRATVRDLLMSRGGIYHPAAYEGPATTASHPTQGTHAPGEAWHYSNWGFNALGTIYERATGKDLFTAFAEEIAAPIGMQDFDAGACRAVFEPASDHPAHTMRMSARDLVLFGRLFLNQGRWSGREVIPAGWVTEATTAWSATGRPLPGYGYLWWVLGQDDPVGPGAFAALGTGGQGLAVNQSQSMVVAQVVDVIEGRERVLAADFFSLFRAAG
jgi:CubicO group peptidase (beta-lactamase class C family)